MVTKNDKVTKGIRFSSNEELIIRRKAEALGMNFSTYIRFACLQYKIPKGDKE